MGDSLDDFRFFGLLLTGTPKVAASATAQWLGDVIAFVIVSLSSASLCSRQSDVRRSFDTVDRARLSARLLALS